MIAFRLPSLGADMDKGTLLEWRVRRGDAVKKGDVIAVVDTTKAAIDVECWHDGIVEELLVEPGAEIPVGTVMAVLREAGETPEQVRAQIDALRATPAPAATPVGSRARDRRGAGAARGRTGRGVAGGAQAGRGTRCRRRVHRRDRARRRGHARGCRGRGAPGPFR